MSWPLVKIGDLCSKVTDGSHNPPKGIEFSDYLMLSSKNVFDDEINYESPRYLSEDDFELENRRTDLNAGDVLLTIVGTVGRCAVVSEKDIKFTLQRSVAVLKPTEAVNSRFLMYSLRSMVKVLTSNARGVAQKGIYLKQIKELEIPLPPLEEQKRIAAILDKADSVRRKRQQAIDLADDFLRSVFLDMFGDPVKNPKGWETKPLRFLCDIKGGGTPSKSNKTYWGGDIPWVSPKDMKSLYISTSKDKITSEAIKGSSTKLIDTDSVLMVVRSGVLKHTVPLALTTKPVSINQDMKAFSCRSDLNSHYLLFCLKAFSQFLLGTVRGTTADNLSSDVINNLLMPIPPIEMQERFAAIALKQQSTKVKNKNSSDLSLLSFNSLSQKAFAGEL